MVELACILTAVTVVIAGIAALIRAAAATVVRAAVFLVGTAALLVGATALLVGTTTFLVGTTALLVSATALIRTTTPITACVLSRTGIGFGALKHKVATADTICPFYCSLYIIIAKIRHTIFLQFIVMKRNEMYCRVYTTYPSIIYVASTTFVNSKRPASKKF